ncbi:mitochondrial import inner membrane translocase subunit Tim23-like [Daktulosphaira vitifoliae]|uniref:mitochondrial import inner membrane translocase subunit Tim23-like n=1 Tax=Daktulosphaira vitifoliae TaxID=58002 RepID=UPI0021AA2646|nr:mitochondrial import inner membrane translocase subunit Tim23-like [Daktulosphaira vitifoliae]
MVSIEDTNKIQSPYFNYDPSFLTQTTKPEYIYLEGAGASQRGRFEMAFSQIGSSCLAGSIIGGLRGMYTGFKTTSGENQTATYKRTQILNNIFKNGARLANTFGTVAVFYSAFGVALQKSRDCDDEFNTIISGAATGMLYKSTGGLKKCGIGGIIGFGLATSYCVITSRDKIKEIVKNIFS